MSDQTSTSAIVLFSGGQDSTVCLAWALSCYENVETIGFSYGQRHDVELVQRKAILKQLTSVLSDVRTPNIGTLGLDHELSLNTLADISETSLTSASEIKMTEAGLPSTFVPGRNLLFLTYAAAVGYRRNISKLVGGMCETDFSGYPDCRNDTLQSLQQSLALGMERPIEIVTPLMYLDKAETWALGHKLGGDALTDLIISETHTCYLGVRDQKHDWGYGCGTCPACVLRANGWQKWQQGLPL